MEKEEENEYITKDKDGEHNDYTINLNEDGQANFWLLINEKKEIHFLIKDGEAMLAIYNNKDGLSVYPEQTVRFNIE